MRTLVRGHFNLKGGWESPLPFGVGGACEKERGASLEVFGDGSPGFSEDIFRIIHSGVCGGDAISVLTSHEVPLGSFSRSQVWD